VKILTKNSNGLVQDIVASAMNHVIHAHKHMVDVQRDFGDFDDFDDFLLNNCYIVNIRC